MAYGIFLGGKRAKAMFNGSRVVFKGSIGGSGTTEETLTAPTISLDGDILTMTATDSKTEEFVIFVDGVETATVEAKNITFTVHNSDHGTITSTDTFTVRKGMTWGEWVQWYNTASNAFWVSDSGIISGDSTLIVLSNSKDGVRICGDDVIDENTPYYFYYYGK